MTNLFNFFTIFIAATFINYSTCAQAVHVSFGPQYNHTRQAVRMVHSKDWFFNSDYTFMFTYEHFLRNKSISLFGSYYQFKGVSWIKFKEGEVLARDGFPITAVGFSGVNISRYDIGLNYNLLPGKNKFYFKPLFSLGFQISKPTGVEIYNTLEPINGPDYFELEPITAESLNTSQLTPTLGFRTGFVFWKRLDLGLSVHGTYGFKAYQRKFFKYSYRGVPQETAIFEDTGTGMVVALGVGFRFVKQ